MQSTVAIGALLGALLVALTALSKVPTKVDAHVRQTDSLVARVQETNQKLDRLVCIAAKLDTPINCAFRK